MSVCAGPLELVTPPTGRVLSLGEARRQCRIPYDITSEDADLLEIIDHARQFVEKEIHGQRQLLTATYEMPLEAFWEGPLRLPLPPLASFGPLRYYDTDDVLQTVDSDSYLVRKPYAQPGYVELHHDHDWPAVNVSRRWPVLARFTAGYATVFTADAATDVITAVGRAFVNGDRVVLSKATDAVMPGGLAERTPYYAVNSDGATCKLAATEGGPAIDVTSAGDGLLFVGEIPGPARRAVRMLVSHWLENREAMLVGTISKEVEFAVTACCRQLMWGSCR